MDELRWVFGMKLCVLDLRDDGHGVIELPSPFGFKWSMYDTTESWGALSGRVSIYVGLYTKYNHIGTDVINSSECHPDALRGSGIKAPAKKKARRPSPYKQSRL